MAIPYNKRTHHCGELRGTNVGEQVILAGWVNSKRDHGGLTFIDLRDHTGFTQLRLDRDKDAKNHEIAQGFHNEDVVAVSGTVVSRGDMIKDTIPTGEIEIEVVEVEVISPAEPLPFPINEEFDASEELCLKYRFLHMRRPEVQKVLRLRHTIAHAVREYFHTQDFIEIETPFLTKSTPEGARDYLVPSRVRPGAFYALPQSPQIFKQLFMIAGFDRYAQIVRCFRDEDLRADRQPEFTQVDVEMAFVQREDVMAMVEGCAQRIFKDALGVDIPLPLPQMTYAEAMDRFGHDAPDTRFGMELQDVTDLVREVDFKVFKEAIEAGGIVKCIVAKGAAAKLTRKVTDGLQEELRGIGAGGLPLVKVGTGDDGVAFSTGIAKFVSSIAGPICEKVGGGAGRHHLLHARQLP